MTYPSLFDWSPQLQHEVQSLFASDLHCERRYGRLSIYFNAIRCKCNSYSSADSPADWGYSYLGSSYVGGVVHSRLIQGL